MTRYVWLAPADRFLVDHYEAKGPTWVAKQLGITPEQAQQRAYFHGLRTKAARGRPFCSGFDPRRGEGVRFSNARSA